MNSYEAKQAARKARLEARADALSAQSQSTLRRAHKMAEGIPFGQPILVGHHSEGRDRRYRAKISGTFEKGMRLADEAAAVVQRAASAGSGGVSSDDPDAASKLRERLAMLEDKQAKMIRTNAIIRRAPKNELTPAKLAALVDMGISEANAGLLFTPDFCGRIGVPDFETKNNGANIRRIRERIAELEKPKPEAAAPLELDGRIRVIEFADENRIGIVFPSKPLERVRSILKSYGFRWSPTLTAWVRMLNNGGRATAELVARRIASGAP